MTTNKFNRREFLQLGGLGTLFALSGCQYVSDLFSTSPKEITILSGFRNGEPYESTEVGISIITQNSRKRILLENEIHSVIRSENLDLNVYISKLDLYSYFQFGDGPIKRIQAGEGNYFYGHAAIDEKRKLVYFSEARIVESRSEFDRRSEHGYIYAYKLPDLTFVERFTSYGSDPHDLKILGDELVVCNGGADSNVCFINLDTKALVRDYKVNQEHLSLRHIEVVDSENFNVIPLSRDDNRPCPPYRLNLKSGLQVFPASYMVDMSMFRLQILSGLVHEGYFYGTCPAMDTVAVWNKDLELIGGVEIFAANNLAYSKTLGGVIVGSGGVNEPARLLKIVDGKLQFEKLYWAASLSGAHSLIIES